MFVGSFLTVSRGKKERYMLLRLLGYAKITKDRRTKLVGKVHHCASILKLVTWGRYAAAARSRMCTSSNTSCPLNPPKIKSRESARSEA